LHIYQGPTYDSNVICTAADGTLIDMSRTTTNGIQECINYGHAKRYGSVYLHAGVNTYINVHGPVILPASSKFKFIQEGLWNYAGPEDQSAIIIDSHIDSEIRLGTIVYSGNKAAIEFRPTTFEDGAISITDLTFYVQGVFNNHGSGVGVWFNGANGGFTYNDFNLGLQIGGFQNSVKMTGTPSFAYNKVFIGHIAGSRSPGDFAPAGIDVSAQSVGNEWTVSSENLGSEFLANSPIRTAGTNDVWNVNIIGGKGAPSLTILPGANGNHFNIVRLDNGYADLSSNQQVFEYLTRGDISGLRTVGIGTTEPRAPLDVRGRIRADELCIGSTCLTESKLKTLLGQ